MLKTFACDYVLEVYELSVKYKGNRFTILSRQMLHAYTATCLIIMLFNSHVEKYLTRSLFVELTTSFFLDTSAYKQLAIPFIHQIIQWNILRRSIYFIT